MPLHNDYRPQTLDEFFGNETTVESLKKTLANPNKPHTYMFVGPTGCGKTTLARIVANMLGCSDMDIAEYNISDTRGIDSAREIIASCRFEPLSGNARVIILDECQQATKDFQNSMLKILEEPPSKVYFILCTTDPDKLLATIKTRASTFNVKPLDKNNMESLIWGIGEAEKKHIEDKVVDAIIQEADGCPRRALVILDQIIGIEGEENQIKAIPHIIEQPDAINICRILLGNSNNKWKEITPILKEIDKDSVESVRQMILSYMNTTALNNDVVKARKAIAIMAEFIEPYFNSGKAGLTFSCYSCVSPN